MANARLGWFSPLGLAASIRASARWLAFGFTTSAFRHALIRSGRWAGSFFRLPLRRFRSAGWPSGSPLPLFGTHRFGVALGGLAFGLTASAFRHAPLRRLQLGELAFGLTTSAFRHAPLRSYPRRVGLRAHGFRFSARTDPHRRTAEARADGAHRHDTCFTSKYCCPVNFKTAEESSPKPFRIGLRAFFFEKQAPPNQIMMVPAVGI